MALAIVQTASNVGAAPATLATTFGSASTTSNLLVTSIMTRSSTLTNPTDFTTNVEVENTTESDWGRIASKISAGETVITWGGMSGSDSAAAKSWEISGNDATPFDKSGSTGRTTGASGISSGNTGTLSQAAEIAIAIACIRSTVTGPSVDSSFTNLTQDVGGSGGTEATLLAADRIVAATTALEPTWSWTGSVTCWAMIATYKESGGAPATGWGPLLAFQRDRLLRTVN